jgi:hypothetical protein
VNDHIQTGQFRDADEVLEKAPDALDESGGPSSSGQAAKSGHKRTGADLIAALQASPYANWILNRPVFVYPCLCVT